MPPHLANRDPLAPPRPTKPKKPKNPRRVLIIATLLSVVVGGVGGVIGTLINRDVPFWFGFFFGFTLMGMAGMFWLAVHMTDF